MSYTQRFTTSVTVSGSKTVSYSYPASEHGGSGSKTVYFQETVPVNINIHVDTTPFDQSVAIANATVDTLTGAVVSMNSSQCSAIHESGEKISNALTEGFYKLIGSELTTQISENKSILQSKIALVIELSKDIANKHGRMAEDMNRLKRHYSEVFDAIDEDCEKRILALDKPAFNLFKARENLIKEPYTRDGVFPLQETKDISSCQTLSVVGRLRSKVSDVIKIMTGTALNTQKYLRDINTFAKPGEVKEKVKAFVPVVYCEQTSLKEEGCKEVVSVFNSELDSEELKEKIKDFVLGSQAEKWDCIQEGELKLIDQWFMNYAEQDLNNSVLEDKQRVYDQIMSLWKNKALKTLDKK